MFSGKRSRVVGIRNFATYTKLTNCITEAEVFATEETGSLNLRDTPSRLIVSRWPEERDNSFYSGVNDPEVYLYEVT